MFARRTVLLVAAYFLGMAGVSVGQEDKSGLTRAKYVRNCLMCHSRAAPEGVSLAILVGLYPERGLQPGVAMPGVVCWRRCDHCFAPERKVRP